MSGSPRLPVSTVTPSEVAERPSRAVMYQTWSDIVWCHWPVAADRIARLLPPGLVPQLFEGSAWIGLIPFAMSELRLPGVLSPLSRTLGVGSFGEVNVRTYVIGPDGRSGVWFFTLDADRLLAVATAQVAFGLPYRHAATQLERTDASLSWTSVRSRDKRRAEVSVAPSHGVSQPAAVGLERFLVERYALYSWWHGRLVRGTLSHEPWQVRSGELLQICSDTVDAAGIEVTGAPHVLVGDPVHVTVHPLARVRPVAT